MAEDPIDNAEELIGTIELSFDETDDRFVGRAHFAAVGECEVRGGNASAVLNATARAAAFLVEAWEEENAIAEEDVEVLPDDQEIN